MGVIRTLLDRCETLVTEEEDKQKERKHMKEALTRCRYPQWTISTVQRKMKKEGRQHHEKDGGKRQEQRHGGTSIYVQGLSGTTSRIMKKYKVNRAMKPHNTIIACKNCNARYIGETKRTLGTCIKEHKEDSEKALASRPYN